MTSITITRPDDWHIHLRDGVQLKDTVRDVSRYMGRAIIMPNLVPPATNTVEALAYRQRIMNQNPQGAFEPLMVLYLTDNTAPDEIRKAKATGQIVAAKLYPAGATTNSDSGVTSVKNIYPALEAMQDVGMPLLLHGEVTDASIDIFDREKVFIDTHLGPIVDAFPKLKVVFEHITTADAASFVAGASEFVGATITPQHLLLNRNDLLVGGVRPHNYCLPVLKRNTHQKALRDMVASGNKKFFLGTDSAPHAKHKKENACGCAGCYSAWSAIELYAEVFEQLGAIDKLEGFASHYGADFYGLPRNTTTMTLVKESWTVPEQVTLADGTDMVPFYAGQTLQWKLEKAFQA